MAILNLIKYISPAMRSVFVDGLLYTAMTDQERLALVIMVSMELSSVPDALPDRVCVVDAQSGTVLGLEGEIY